MPKTYFCPYYKYDEKRLLRCEAGHLDFYSAEQKSQYIEQYCANLSGYKYCTLASSLEHLYGGDDPE